MIKKQPPDSVLATHRVAEGEILMCNSCITINRLVATLLALGQNYMALILL